MTTKQVNNANLSLADEAIMRDILTLEQPLGNEIPFKNIKHYKTFNRMCSRWEALNANLRTKWLS